MKGFIAGRKFRASSPSFIDVLCFALVMGSVLQLCNSESGERAVVYLHMLIERATCASPAPAARASGGRAGPQ
jgi:hypothetical protein